MDRDDLEVDAEIRRAHTLPGRVYTDPAIYELAKDRVFARSWQFAGDAMELRAPGHVRPVTLLPGCLDEPVVLARTYDASVHCFSNVCTHRGALVVEGEGFARHLRCRYHGRRFELDGRFVSMPEFDQTENFPTSADDLPRLPFGEWGRFFFAGIDPAFSLDELLAPMQERVGWMPLDQFAFDAAGSHDYLVKANWALYCDNYLEEFHIPYVHPVTLGDKVDYGAYRTETFAYSSVQIAVAKPGEDAFELPEGHPDYGERVAAYYFFLFPNLMFNFYPWGLSINVVQPLAVDRTKVSFLAYVWDASKRDQGLGAALHVVEWEDEEVVQSVQQGLRSRLYSRGRFSARREVGTHHFHRLLGSFLQ